jgi:hypothetical protein
MRRIDSFIRRIITCYNIAAMFFEMPPISECRCENAQNRLGQYRSVHHRCERFDLGAAEADHVRQEPDLVTARVPG